MSFQLLGLRATFDEGIEKISSHGFIRHGSTCLLPSQIVRLMQMEMEDLIPLITAISWPIFGSVMALRYPTQKLRIAAGVAMLFTLQYT